MTMPLPGLVPRIGRRFGLGALLAGAAFAVLSQSISVEVIPLRHRNAQELIPVLQPLAGPGGSVSAFQGQLVVRATAEGLAQIRQVLDQLDVPPRQLVITVRQEGDVRETERSAEISGRVGGERGRVVIPGRRDGRGGSAVLRNGDDRVRGRVQDSASSAADRNLQSLRVLEGREAFIQIGQSVPVRERQVERFVVDGRVIERTVTGAQYRDIGTGFHVLPRLAGDRVTLEISPRRESLSGEVRGGVNVQSLTTTVSGPLGEWLEIGATTQDASGRQTVLLGRTDHARRDVRRILVRVEEAR